MRQRSRYFGNVALDHRRGAMAFPCRIAKVSTGTGFMAAASINGDGNITETAARAMVTMPSSSG